MRICFFLNPIIFLSHLYFMYAFVHFTRLALGSDLTKQINVFHIIEHELIDAKAEIALPQQDYSRLKTLFCLHFEFLVISFRRIKVNFSH